MKTRAIHLLVSAIVLVNVTTLVVWWLKSQRRTNGGPPEPTGRSLQVRRRCAVIRIHGEQQEWCKH